MKISIFGASKLGEFAFEYLKDKYKIEKFIDNDKKKQGNKFLGSEVIGIKKYNNLVDGKIIVASQYNYEIVDQLIKNGILEFGVYEKNSLEKVSFYNYSNKKNFNLNSCKIALVCDNNSGSNSVVLYKYLKKCEKFRDNVVLINQKEKNEDYYYDLVTSNVILKTHEGVNIEGKINIQLWHGFPYKTLGKKKKVATAAEIVWKDREWKKLKTVISYSELYNLLMKECYAIEDFNITGMPRNDLLFDSDGKKNIKKLLGIENKKIILYMPTFRESYYGEVNGHEGFIFNSEDFFADKFNSFLEEKNAVFLFKTHPYDITSFKNKFDNYNNIIDLNDFEYEGDLYEYINGVDILVTDYSSIYFDYLLLDKPVIFYIADRETYVENRGELLRPFDFWMVGDKTGNCKELLNSIEFNLKNDNYFEKRKKIKNLVHKYQDNKSCFRIFKYIEEMIEKEVKK